MSLDPGSALVEVFDCGTASVQISQLEEEKAASRSASETQIAALHVQLQEATSRVDSKTREVSEVHAEMKRCREEMRETTNANEELLFQCSQLADRHEKETLRLQDDFNRKLREEKRKVRKYPLLSFLLLSLSLSLSLFLAGLGSPI